MFWGFKWSHSLFITGSFAAIALQPAGVVDIVAFGTSPILRTGHKTLGGLGLIATLTAFAPFIIGERTPRAQPVHGDRRAAARVPFLAVPFRPGSGPRTMRLLIERLLLSSPGLHTHRQTLEIRQLRFDQPRQSLHQPDRRRRRS